MPYTFIEVCSGCGGLSTGFMRAGLKPILLNEINKTFCKTLENNHPGVKVVNQDMTKLNLKEYDGEVDVLAGGVPCQSFSQAGVRKGLEDPRGQLIIEFNRLINECNPNVFMIENVKGILTHDSGKTFQSILELLKNGGLYKIKYKVMNSKDYEVPQKRERVVIIGVRSDIPEEFSFPEFSKNSVFLRDVLSNVPASIGAKYPESKRKVMELVPQGGCWVNLPENVKREFMGEKSMKAGGGKRGMARRMGMDEQCLTLTTSPCQKQTERCHPLETRPFNVREYARIQTFPDDYTFEGGMANQYKQIGNAVPVKMAEAIGNSLKQFLEAAYMS
jgi:DNA (cytosine-5)-methyltransferase 1